MRFSKPGSELMPMFLLYGVKCLKLLLMLSMLTCVIVSYLQLRYCGTVVMIVSIVTDR